MASSIKDIKIPYPTEGVIRTAQLDDTVSPEDSVQLAVNMNFDRIGAIQTRQGVSEYADSLEEKINSFGKLSNSYIPNGYKNISQYGSSGDFSTTVEVNDLVAVKISDTKVSVFWRGNDNDGYCQNIKVDSDTGEVISIGTVLEFDTSTVNKIVAVKLDDDYVLAAWQGSSSDGFTQVFDVSEDNIVAKSTALEFDTDRGDEISIAQVNSRHVICFYSGDSNEGTATIFEVNGSSFAVTQPASSLVFQSDSVYSNSCVALGDGERFMNCWENNDSGSGQAQMFFVNTSTWAITALDSIFTYDTTGTNQVNISTTGDGQHFVSTSVRFNPSLGYYAQVFEVNLTSYAITEVGTGVRFAGSGIDLATIEAGDGEHFIAFYTSSSLGEGYVQMLEMDPVTYNMSVVGDLLEGYDFSYLGRNSPVMMTDFKPLVFWGSDTPTEIGKYAMFSTTGDVVGGNFLYAGHTTKVSNLTGSTWTSRRSGLSEVSKPQFSQYLSYIWMVNGNKSIGGDPVATSRGGDFGTDLIPKGFPTGDFIHAGFEGRVWVFNKTLGRIDYTDIVQFIPPNEYKLTYSSTTNFITTLAPQTGQTFTAVHQVPRALLVFTQDNIFRIYGATSLDAYPAYNVGTYSQESIVETKTGILFHHSSGFYEFDYGSQPVEISRKVIDFIKAIPRAYYDDITGVYDGFDNVEWSVGPITTEGVTFSSCVMRYTLSTQVWTIYDYTGNNITAMIQYDNGTTLNHLMGTNAGLIGAMDTGVTDFGESIYYEMIDRWRSFTDMYYTIASIDGINVYSENAAGTNIMYQINKSGTNVWKQLGAIDEKENSYLPNNNSEDFGVLRLRLAGNTTGTPVVIHGIEIPQIVIKGSNRN